MRRVSAAQTWSALRPRGRTTLNQVADGGLDQGCPRAGPANSDTWGHLSSCPGSPGRHCQAPQSINRMPTMGGQQSPAGGFLRIQHCGGRHMPCSISVILGWASIHVSIASWLIAASGVGRVVHRSHCATRLQLQTLVWSGRGVRPRAKQVTRRRRTVSRSRSRFLGQRLTACCSPGARGPDYAPSGPRWRANWRHTTEGLHPTQRAIHTWDKPASSPTIIAARSQTLRIRRQPTSSPSNSATTQNCQRPKTPPSAMKSRELPQKALLPADRRRSDRWAVAQVRSGVTRRSRTLSTSSWTTCRRAWR